MKMWHKLLLIIACLVLLAFSAFGEKAPAPPKKEQTDAPQEALLSEEELSQIGKAAVEKWATIGYIVSEPLYNTALSQLGQNELREIYSAHIYASGLESSLVREDERIEFCMDLGGLEEFTREYFGLDFNNQQNNLPDGCLAGDEIRFYFNSRFYVAPADLYQYSFISCTQNDDNSFIAHVKIKNASIPELDIDAQVVEAALTFRQENDTAVFISAST